MCPLGVVTKSSSTPSLTLLSLPAILQAMKKKDPKLTWEKSVRTERVDCVHCGGKQRRERLVPRDLQLWRMRHGVSQEGFAESLVSPKTGKKVHLTVVSNVENGRMACPEWLAEEYRRIPEKTFAPPGNKALFDARLEKLLRERGAGA